MSASQKELLVIAKGYYGLGGSLAVLADAMWLGDQLNCKVVADWQTNPCYSVSYANVAELLFPDIGFEKMPTDFTDLKVWPEAWQSQVEQTVARHQAVDGINLSRFSVDQLVQVGIEQVAATYDIIVLTRDSTHYHQGTELRRYYSKFRLLPEQSDRLNSIGLTKKDIGVHFRHGNGEKVVIPPHLEWYYHQIDKQLEASPEGRLFVCSDSRPVLDHFISRYGHHRVLTSPKLYNTPGSGAMHFAVGDEARLASAHEALFDIWGLASCGSIVCCRSFFTGAAMHIGDFDKTSVHIYPAENRTFKPADNQVAIDQVQNINYLLKSRGIYTDGIYVEFKESGMQLYYQAHPIVKLPSTDIEPNIFNAIQQELLRLRYY